MKLRPHPDDPNDPIGTVRLGKAKIEIEYSPEYDRWEANEKATIWNLWLGSFLCFGDSREAVIEKARVILQEKAKKETVEVDL